MTNGHHLQNKLTAGWYDDNDDTDDNVDDNDDYGYMGI